MSINFGRNRMEAQWDYSALDDLDPFTWLIWAKPTSLDGGPNYNYVMVQRDAAHARQRYLLALSNGRSQVTVLQATTNATAETTGTAPFVNDQWSLVAVTYDSGATPRIQLFQGTLTAAAVESSYLSQVNGSGSPVTADGDFYCSLVDILDDDAFDGSVAVCAAVNRVLTLAEIRNWQFAPRVLDDGFKLLSWLGFEGADAGPYPVIETSSTSTQDSDTTSHTVTMPSGVASGDMLIALFANDGSATVTWPSGWTSLRSNANGSAVRLSSAYRESDGTEGASITVTTSASEESAHIVYRLSAHEDPAVFPPEADPGVASGTSTAPDPPVLAPTDGGRNYTWILFEGHDGSATTTGLPTDFSNSVSVQSSGANPVGIAACDRQYTIHTQNPDAFTISGSSAWLSNGIAISENEVFNLPDWSGNGPPGVLHGLPTVSPNLPLGPSFAFEFHESHEDVNTMFLDTLEKRAAVSGVGRPWMRGKLPVATPDQEWRMSSGLTYGGNLLSPLIGVIAALRRRIERHR